MSKPITADAVRPSVSDITFSKIPFGPSVRSLRPGTVKAMAAVTRSSWVEPETRRRVSLATNRQLAELAGATDPETIGRHVRGLAEAGVITTDEHEGRRRLILPEVQPGEFVVLDNADPAWTLNPVPFVVLLAVRSCDWTNRGQVWPTDAYIARTTGLSVQSVSRSMVKLRRAGMFDTSSLYDPARRTRKRVITLPGKVTTLCADSTTRKSDEWVPGKVTSGYPENRLVGTRKSDYLNQNSEREFLTTTATTNQPANGLTGQSERAETAEAEVVVVDVKTSTDTDPKPKPKAEAPPEDFEVESLLAKSKLSRDEQERYLRVTRKMDEPPPLAWHRYALDVQPSSGTRSLAGVVINRLKAWETTPPDQRSAIVEEYVQRAERAKKPTKLIGYEAGYAMACRALDRGECTVEEARAYYVKVSEARKAAGLSPILIDARIIRAEREEKANASVQDDLQPAPTSEPAAAPQPPAALAPPEPRPEPPPVDPVEQERRRRERAERERAEALQRERSRIESERGKKITSRVEAYEQQALMLLTLNSPPGGLNAALDHFRTVDMPRKLAEIVAEVRAEFAPKLAALAPTRKPPAPPPGPPAMIPAMVSR